MVAKRLMNVHESLEYSENLDVSSEDDLSSDDDFILGERLVILPPSEEGDREAGEDSGDESELLLNTIERSLLLVGATVDLSTSSRNISLSYWRWRGSRRSFS